MGKESDRRPYDFGRLRTTVTYLFLCIVEQGIDVLSGDLIQQCPQADRSRF